MQWTRQTAYAVAENLRDSAREELTEGSRVSLSEQT